MYRQSEQPVKAPFSLYWYSFVLPKQPSIQVQRWIQAHTQVIRAYCYNYCPVLLPRQNMGQKKLSKDKIGKRIENDFLAAKKIDSWLKNHFPTISKANLYFFSLGQNFLPGTKIFCLGHKICCPGRREGHTFLWVIGNGGMVNTHRVFWLS